MAESDIPPLSPPPMYGLRSLLGRVPVLRNVFAATGYSEVPTMPKDDVYITTEAAELLNHDEAVLARFNKKQRLLRRFGTLSAIGTTSTLMISWEAMTVIFSIPLTNGGPAGAIINFIICWVGACLQGAVLAEMASMAPLAGGPFNWVAIFAPKWCRKFLSYLAGWLTVITYCALVAGACYVSGTLIQTLIQVQNPSYDAPAWQGTLIYWAMLGLSLFVNTFLGSILPQIESMLLFLHIFAFIAVMVPLLYLGDHISTKEVFTTFMNEGGWSSQSLSVFVGSVAMFSTFIGLDGVDHIAEELHDAPRTIPIAIGTSVGLNGGLAFAMLLTLLYCMPADIKGLLNDYPYYPFIGIYKGATEGGSHSNSGMIALVSLVIVTNTAGSIGMLATTSRMLWAFAREGGLPFSRYLSRVDPKTHLPLWSIVAVVLVNILIGIINLGSTVGFSALTSLGVAGYYSAFILAAAVMLHKRLTTPEEQIPWGPFRLGKWGTPIYVLSLAYSIVGTFFSFWPTKADTTIEEMNYSPLIFGATIVFAIIFWFAHGKRRYTGPVVEIIP